MISRNLVLAILIFFGSCSVKNNPPEALLQIPYPHPLPDTTPLRFLPGIVSTDTLDFNSAFSSDGQSYYFARSFNRKWDIYVSRYHGGKWTQPIVASFCTPRFSEADPAFAPDGKLYYISDHHTDTTRKDHDIWVTQLQSDGSWSTPENVSAVNSDSSEYYVAFAGNGNLYFGSSRQGGFGSHDIYVSRYVDGKFSTPENLGPQINSSESEHDPCVSKDETFMIFKSENRPDGFGEADLYGILRTAEGWTQPVNLGANINTSTWEYCSYLTPDDKYFFYSSELDVKWVSAQYVRNIVARGSRK